MTIINIFLLYTETTDRGFDAHKRNNFLKNCGVYEKGMWKQDFELNWDFGENYYQSTVYHSIIMLTSRINVKTSAACQIIV